MKNKAFKILMYLTFIGIFSGCDNQIKFDKVKWQQHEDAGQPSPYRKRMLNDLTANYKLTGKKYSDIISILGSPSFKDSLSFGYDIIVDYGSDIDPVYTKTLDFVFSKSDSIITSIKIKEWRKK